MLWHENELIKQELIWIIDIMMIDNEFLLYFLYYLSIIY